MDGKKRKTLGGWREEGIGRRDEKVEGRGGKKREMGRG